MSTLQIITRDFACETTASGETAALRWDLRESGERITLRLESAEETELKEISIRFALPFEKRDML